MKRQGTGGERAENGRVWKQGKQGDHYSMPLFSISPFSNICPLYYAPCDGDSAGEPKFRGGGDGYERDRNTRTRGRSPRVDVNGLVGTFLVPSFFVLLPFLMNLTLLLSTGNEDTACRTRLCRRTGKNRDKWPRPGGG